MIKKDERNEREREKREGDGREERKSKEEEERVSSLKRGIIERRSLGRPLRDHPLKSIAECDNRSPLITSPLDTFNVFFIMIQLEQNSLLVTAVIVIR